MIFSLIHLWVRKPQTKSYRHAGIYTVNIRDKTCESFCSLYIKFQQCTQVMLIKKSRWQQTINKVALAPLTSALNIDRINHQTGVLWCARNDVLLVLSITVAQLTQLKCSIHLVLYKVLFWQYSVPGHESLLSWGWALSIENGSQLSESSLITPRMVATHLPLLWFCIKHQKAICAHVYYNIRNCRVT